MTIPVDKNRAVDISLEAIKFYSDELRVDGNHGLADALIELRQQLTASEKEAARLRKIVERIASAEAFDVSRAIDSTRDRELLARINYAAFSLEAK